MANVIRTQNTNTDLYNKLNYSTWIAGQSSAVGFYQNGPNIENMLVLASNPWATQTVIWETRASGDGNDDGGWNTDYFTIDNTKLYRHSVWVKRISSTGTGNFYLGTNGFGQCVIRLSDGGEECNPYWHCGSPSDLTQDQWYLVVGHCFPYTYSSSSGHPDTGFWTRESGKVFSINGCNIGPDCKSGPGTTSLNHRTYHYYGADNTTKLHFLQPRIDLCDGTQPSIQDLLNGFGSADPINTVKVKPFVIGVNQGGYGPTSLTHYYNGKTPNVGAYTIYVNNGLSSPTLYSAANDAQLITYSNQLGGSGNTTIGQALTYFNSSTTMACVNVGVPSIVTSGLVLNLDAGLTPSYPRTGTAWTDISGGNNDGTLINNPTYSGASGGSIVFDGVDDYSNTNKTASQLGVYDNDYTFDAWVYPTDLSSDRTLFGSDQTDIRQGLHLVFRNGVIYQGHYGSDFGAGSATLNQWNYITYTYTKSTGAAKIYKNGVLQGSGTIDSFIGSSVILIGRWAGVYLFVGNGSNYKVYNRVLSDAEVLQNYYAGLQRFIPTDGLVLYLDGNNTDKQVLAPTIANDVSGNNNNGILVNGVTLTRDGQRSFLFDGVDDYISMPYSSTFDFSLGQTIILWLKPGTGASSQRRNPYNQAYGGSGTITHEPAGDFSYFFGTNGGNDFPYSYFGSGFTVVENEQAFIAVTRNQTTNTCNFYKNGTLTNTGTAGGYATTNNGSSPIQIGYGYTGWVFVGNIGQVRVYDRALTAAEISTIYTATKSRYGL